CANIVTPVITGACPGDTGQNVLTWHSPVTGTVTTQSFLKSGGTGGTTQFVDLVDGDQSGVGITSQVGANLLDNEITNFGSVANGISLTPASSSHTRTTSLYSLQ